MADLETLVQRLEADTARFDQAMEEAQNQLRALDKSAGAANRSLGVGFQRSSREVAKAEAGLRTLKLSLGGAEAASVRLALAQAHITAALNAGLISQGRAIELSNLATAAVTRQAVAANGLSVAYGRAGIAGAALGRLVPGLAALFSVTAITGAISNTIAYAAALDDAAAAAGVGVEALQQWRFAGEQTGITVDRMDDGIQRLNQRLGQFVNTGGGPAKTAFDQLGLSARIASGELSGSEEVLEALFEALAAIPDAARRSALASAAFGEEVGPKLAAMAGEGHAAIQDLIDQAPVLTDAQTQAAREIDRAWKEMTSNVGTYIKGLILDFAGMAVLGEQLVDEAELIDELQGARAHLRELEMSFSSTTEEIAAATEEVGRLEAAMARLGGSRQRLLGFEPPEIDIRSAAGFEPTGGTGGRIIGPAPMSRGEAQDFGLDVVSTHRAGTAEDYASSLEALRQMSQEQAKLNAEIGLTPAAVEEVNVAYNLALDTARQFASITASGLTEAIFAGQGFKETMGQIGIEIAKAATQAIIFNSLMGALGGFGAGGGAGAAGGGGLFGAIAGLFGGGKQHGGRVDPDKVYAVGERGVELFKPDSAGEIIPHREMMRAMAAPRNFAPVGGGGGGGAAAMPRVEVGGVHVIDQRGRGAPPIETSIDARGLATIVVRSEITNMARDGSLNRITGARPRGIARG